MNSKNFNLITNLYVKNNFPGLEKLYILTQKNNKQITRKEIKDFLESQYNYQLLKVQPIINKPGHIVALFVNELWQMDIFVMQKYSSSNKQYGYLFVIIDVFTRRAGVVPMKKKDSPSCVAALEILIKKLGKPRVILSDNDKAFLSKSFTQLIDTNEIILQTNIKDDHKALGIIDRFARTLKTIISKYFLYTKTTKWLDQIDSIISIYNDTPHRSLDYLTPNEASEDSHYQQILDINIAKNKVNKLNQISDLKPDDKVRIKLVGTFKKGTEPNFSDEVYTVGSVNNQNITLSNGKRYKRTNLLKLPDGYEQDDRNQTPNVIKSASTQSKHAAQYKKESTDVNNIIDKNNIINKRQSKLPSRYLT